MEQLLFKAVMAGIGGGVIAIIFFAGVWLLGFLKRATSGTVRNDQSSRQPASPQPTRPRPNAAPSVARSDHPVGGTKSHLFYDRAIAEVNEGRYDRSLWVAAMTTANGDVEEARLEYARTRAAQLKALDRALSEVGTDWYDKDLWAKAMVATNGDTDTARHEYARLRVDYWQSRTSGKPASPSPALNPLPVQPSSGAVNAGEPSMVIPAESLVVDEDAIYASIANELKTGATNEGLWTRLFAECDGDENRTKVAYIKQRAEFLISNERARLAQAMQEQATEANRITEARHQHLRVMTSNLGRILTLAAQHSRNPRMTIDEKDQLLKLAGGSFAWVDGYGKCSATFPALGPEQQFNSGEAFASWFRAEVVPYLLIIEDPTEAVGGVSTASASHSPTGSTT